MAIINRTQLLADEKLWLPAGNALTDQLMEAINESIITQVGDDGGTSGTEGNYPEILCKALKAIALTNQPKASVDTAGKKKEKVGDIEVEKFEATSIDNWKNFIDSLKDVCPLLGYTGLSSGAGMTISPSEKFIISTCPCPDDLTF